MKKITVTLLILLGVLPMAAQLNTDRTLQVGRNALYFSDYVLSIQYFNQVIEAKPYLAEPYYLRAIAKYNLEDFAGAASDSRRATELNPFMPDAWEVRGVAAQCLDNHTEAIGYYDRALELLPHNRQMLFNKALAQEAAKLFEASDSTYGELIATYPRFDAAYLGRAQLSLHRGDSVSARADLDRALEINANSVGALTLRAALSRDVPAEALAYMDRAVVLQPDRAWLRTNRAVARYNANDLNGALDDLDYVLEAEPMNYEALFNRAMLRAELHDNDRALVDLDRALQLRPSDLRARFSRAAVLADKGEYTRALADADAVLEAYPSMFAAYALRSQINHQAGNKAAAQADYRRARQLASSTEIHDDVTPDAVDDVDDTINRFKALQMAKGDDDATAQTFNAKGLRARVQTRNEAFDMQPIYQLTYYTAADDHNGAYDREIEQLNAARVLPFVVFLTNNLPAVTREADAARHFENIQHLGPVITSGKARPLDLFARSMDYVTVKDYAAALADLDAVIAAQGDFAPAYLMRAAVRFRLQESQQGTVVVTSDATMLNASATMALEQIMADLDRALDLNPRMAVAHYNRGVVLLKLTATADAIESFTKAIEIDPNLGPAYFNRGYALFSQGNRREASADLSKAGQLGVTSAYTLLKQMQ